MGHLGVHLLANKQGLNPDYTIADARKGLRAGQAAVWPDTPCHGGFHIQHQCQGLANFLSPSDWSHCQTATAGAQNEPS